MVGRLKEDPDVRDAFVTLSRAMEQAIDESRRIMSDLRPSVLDDFGIISTIRWFCGEFGRIYSASGCKGTSALKSHKFRKTCEIIIFRIIQEAMNNAAKHSKAGKIALSLTLENGSIVLSVSDDGMASTWPRLAQKDRGRLRLTSMRERATVRREVGN